MFHCIVRTFPERFAEKPMFRSAFGGEGGPSSPRHRFDPTSTPSPYKIIGGPQLEAAAAAMVSVKLTD